jgi:hypothetical protein
VIIAGSACKTAAITRSSLDLQDFETPALVWRASSAGELLDLSAGSQKRPQGRED